MNTTRYFTAKEAAQALGVSRATLYAYVSRGLVRSEAVGSDKRARRYYAEDVKRLQQQKALRSNPRQAGQALHWGAPLIESQITLIADGKLYYRGLDVAELAQKASIEEVASLIWLGERRKGDSLFGQDKYLLDGSQEERLLSLGELPPMTRFQVMLPLLALEDWAAYELSREMVAQTGARILQTMAGFAVNGIVNEGIVHTLLRGWGVEQPNAQNLLNAALVLCADHEFNVSAFTARCVASAGSTPYEVVQAGLAALQGVKHGGQTKKVTAFLRTVHDLSGIRPTIREYLARGEPIPGFGHKLYAMGDPRATILLQMLTTQYPNASVLALGQQIITELYNITGKHPNIDFALVMLAHVLNLPPSAPLTLFALGRTIGWIGHAIEQYENNELIRPRARYTGKVPSAQ